VPATTAVFDQSKRTLLITLTAATLLASSRGEAQRRVFVANSGDNTVSVIDGDLDREVAVIPVGNFPQGLALREEEPLLAVANSRGNSVTLIDPVTLQPGMDKIPACRFPLDMKFSADGKLLFCTCYDDQSVVVVDIAARTVVGEPVPIGAPPPRVKLSKDGALLYVLQYQENGGVVVIDTTTRTVTKTVRVGPFPTDMVIQPDGERLFVASFNTDTVTVVDLGKLDPVETLELPVGNGLLIHPTEPLLYSLVTFDDEVSVFDYLRKKAVAAIPVGRHPMYSTMSANGRFVYAVNSSDGNVMKIDTETNQVLVRIAVGVEPTDAASFDPPREHSVAFTVAAAATASFVLLGISVTLLQRSRSRRDGVARAAG
jgi:YVTN family beta-propeller protein